MLLKFLLFHIHKCIQYYSGLFVLTVILMTAATDITEFATTGLGIASEHVSLRSIHSSRDRDPFALVTEQKAGQPLPVKHGESPDALVDALGMDEAAFDELNRAGSAHRDSGGRLDDTFASNPLVSSLAHDADGGQLSRSTLLSVSGRSHGPSIEQLFGPMDDPRIPQLFTAPAPTNVLDLFGGHREAVQSRRVTSVLARREHHLIAMDSAYVPAQVHRST